MRKLFFILFVLQMPFVSWSQERELKPVPEIEAEIEDTLKYSIPEIFIGFDAKEKAYRKDMNILRNRIRRVYPYALATAENLTILNENLSKMTNNSQKRQYIKRSQKYLEEQFKERLKKLSRNDGKILLKLIYRETGQTAYSLIKEFRSGWTAFWSNTTAKAFSLDLKSQYHPDTDLEDFYIETQLNYLFFMNELKYSRGKEKLNMNDLRKMWQMRMSDDELFPIELRE